jgi:hypothetical protein
VTVRGAVARGRLAGTLAEPRPLLKLVLAQQLIGVALGLLWVVWSPSSVSYLFDAGNGTGVVVPAQSEAQVAGDGRYAVLTALAGLAFGLLAWRLRGSRGPAVLGVLTVSSLLGSLLALGTGQLFSRGQHTTTLDTAFHPALVLHGTAEVFLQALFAVLVYTIFVGLSGDRQLGRSDPRQSGEQPGDVSGGGPGDVSGAPGEQPGGGSGEQPGG